MNIASIKADINFLCGSTSATYLDADKIRNVNIAYNDIAREIWNSTDGWQYDDSNATTLPIAKTTMVQNQQDYSLPTTTQRVRRVEVKDSSGIFQKLSLIDYGDIDIANPEFYKTPGLPIYYNLVGRSVLLYPSPSSAYATLASGLAVYVDRDVTEFTVTATSTVPGFATPFHRILSYAASLDFLQDETQKQFVANQKERLEAGLKAFYARRSAELNPRIKPAQKKRWRQYT